MDLLSQAQHIRNLRNTALNLRQRAAGYLLEADAAEAEATSLEAPAPPPEPAPAVAAEPEPELVVAA